MRILITSSRAPVALELIRAFGRAGHTVVATDSLPLTLGSHSRYLARHVVTPAPRHDPDGFAQTLRTVVQAERIDWLIPTCEEVFWIARSYDQLQSVTNVFTSPLPVLAQLHHKGRLQRLAAELGLATPRTVELHSHAELRRVRPAFPDYLLKPAYSRFATQIITNCGAQAGRRPLAACQPTPNAPWLIQAFCHGTPVCSYTTFHHGRATAHCAYTIPYRIGEGAGIAFVSSNGSETLAIAQRIGAALGYTGQLSLDFIATSQGLMLLECNPRTVSAVHLMPSSKIIDGITNAQSAIYSVPPGISGQLAPLVLAQALGQCKKWPGYLRDLVRMRDVMYAKDDLLPVLMQIPMTLSFVWNGIRHGITPTAATTATIEWNGEYDV